MVRLEQVWSGVGLYGAFQGGNCLVRWVRVGCVRAREPMVLLRER